MPVHQLPTAGIWSALQLHSPISSVPAHGAVAGVSPRPRSSSPIPPLRLPSDSAPHPRARALMSEVGTIRARQQRQQEEADRWAKIERMTQNAHTTTRGDHPTALELAYSSHSSTRDDLFPYMPLPPAPPLGSGKSFYTHPTCLTHRDKTLLAACDWSLPAAPPYAPPMADELMSRLSSLHTSSTSEFASGSGSDAFTSHTDVPSSPTLNGGGGGGVARPIFRSSGRTHVDSTRDRSRHSSSIQPPPLAAPSSPHADTNTPSRALERPYRDLPLHNPFVTHESPLTHRSHVSSLIGLTPINHTMRTAATLNLSRSTIGMPSFQLSEYDQSILTDHTTIRSPITPTHTHSVMRGDSHAPRWSASKAQHLADATRIRAQLRAEQRLQSIPSVSNSSASASPSQSGSEFVSTATGDSSTDRDPSAYTMSSSFLSVTHLSDT